MKKVLVTGDYLHDSGETAFIMNSFGKIKSEQVQFDAAIVSGSKEMVAELELKGWHAFIFPAANRHPLAHWRAWQQFFKQHAAEYEAIHFNYSAMWNFLPVYFAKKYGIPVITMHSHNTFFGTAGSSLQIKVLTSLHYLGKKLICRYWANQFLAASKEAAEWLFTPQIIQQQRYKIVRNGINLDKFAYNEEVRQHVRQEQGWTDRRVYANVGVFEPRKNHQFSLAIFRELVRKDDTALLVLVGDGPLQAEVKQQVETFGLSDNVIFLGVRRDLERLYQGFDALLFPSVHEGLSLVFVEGQAAGLEIFPSAQIPLDRYIKTIVHPISLTQSPGQWAKQIESQFATVQQRKAPIDQLRELGYDQAQTVATIQALYSEE
ncbi:glycosyltransferase [Loigolactobacillus zhaoyuanensis]|uniref:glycosyltransferase n=1 Tax=Loigolactobacillus zhaoyuanensis TaxID=2486017 RepID=UPI000F745DE2|nr:glycosyltransferase [Loigolactobacillus zhaoyuanensis]